MGVGPALGKSFLYIGTKFWQFTVSCTFSGLESFVCVRVIECEGILLIGGVYVRSRPSPRRIRRIDGLG